MFINSKRIKLKIVIFLWSFLTIIIANCQVVSETKIDTLEAQTIVETVPSVDGETIRTRLAALQSSVPLKYNEYVHSFVDFFTYRKPSFTKTMLERKNYYFPIFEENLRNYGIPDEIKYLSLIESGLNPKAISYAGAAGLWQFMPKTGRIDFGLRIDKYIDERHHVQKSTEAACKYMRQLYRIFGDWELVLAAYNTGPGNVKRAIRKAGGGGFWEIYPFLHKQTRSYVPQYVAMIYMMHYAADYNIFPEVNESIPPSSPVMVSKYLNLNTLASLSKIPFKELQEVNPHIISTELPETTQDFVLSIPDNFYAYFDQNKDAILDSASKRILPKSRIKIETNNTDDTLIIAKNSKKSKKVKDLDVEPETETVSEGDIATAETDEFEEVAKRKPTVKYHTIKRGENLNTIAKKYDVELYDLKAWNKIKKINDIKSGRRIKLYLEKAPIKAEYFAKNARKKEERSSRNKKKEVDDNKTLTAKTHIVRKGENLYQIAANYGIDIDQLKDLNNIKEVNNIRFGQKLKLVGLVERSDKQEKSNKTKKDKSEISSNENPKFHVVGKGDTIWSIAQRYEGITVEKIKKLNSIKNNNVKLGQKLRIS
jgi:membrane-bound lytic murein transglycosylase D